MRVILYKREILHFSSPKIQIQLVSEDSNANWIVRKVTEQCTKKNL